MYPEKSIYLPQVATITKAEMMTQVDRYFEFALEGGKDLGHKPGQFAEISIPGIGEAPISISSSPHLRGKFEMVIRNVGVVTNALHKLQVGDTVGIRGPYGTHFPMEKLKGRDLLFISGGIGLVPMRSAIHYALENRKDYGRIMILFGARDASQRLFTKELEAWSKQADIEFMETVDVGNPDWKGNVGVITTLCPRVKNLNAANTTAFIVGPPVMYKFVIVELFKMDIQKSDIIVSLERHMKCGVGKCGHCQINRVYVCQEGPVFALDAISELREAI
mgnify:CR=1 FL=1